MSSGLALAGCNVQYRSGTRTPDGRATANADASALATFPVTLDATAVELRSEHDERPGAQGEEICAWTRTFASKAHLGGGTYARVQVPTSTLWASALQDMWTTRVDPTGPCARLGRGVRSDAEVLAPAQKQHGAKTVRAARWLAADWTVIRSPEGAPIEMDRIAEVLSVIRPSGTIQDAPVPTVAMLTSTEVAHQVAKACRFPDGPAMARTPCRVESAAVHHVVHFSTRPDDPTIGYEVMVDATVNLGGAVGVCEMRLFAIDKGQRFEIMDEAQCRASAAHDLGAWGDPRCYTNRCIEVTAASRGPDRPHVSAR